MQRPWGEHEQMRLRKQEGSAGCKDEVRDWVFSLSLEKPVDFKQGRAEFG